jgi:GT2 family glycosyltransferase
MGEEPLTPEFTLPPGPEAHFAVGVLVATSRRPRDLERCLRALARQERPADDVLVVVRDIDDATHRFLDKFDAVELGLSVRKITVAAPGVVAARNAGLAACRTDILAIIDDDTAPHPDWIVRVIDHFARDLTLGGLGGRDRCHDGERFDDRQEPVVGRIRWHGRLVGNHHLGFGSVRDVDYLKGANMTFRTVALVGKRFDERLRGDGAGPHEDMAFSIAVRRGGWRLAYDPMVLVDHYAAKRDEPRHYVSVGRIGNTTEFSNHAFNIVVAVWEDLSAPRRMAFVIWYLLIGTRTCPGVAQALRFTPKLGRGSWMRFVIAQRGLFAAYRMLGMLGSGAERSAPMFSMPGATDSEGAR